MRSLKNKFSRMMESTKTIVPDLSKTYLSMASQKVRKSAVTFILKSISSPNN